VRGVLIYCADYKCSHSIEMSADRWAEGIRLSDIEDQFVCTACGKRGADIRPHFRIMTLAPECRVRHYNSERIPDPA
jgi:hypothetical protein